MNTLVIAEFPLPERADHPDWADYQRLIRLENFETIGGTEWDIPDDDAFVQSSSDATYRRRRFLARSDGVAVGYARLVINHRDDPTAANVMVFVDPAHRGRGVGRRLAEAVRASVGDDTTRLTTWLATPPPSGPALVSPTGHGAVPADHPGIRLAQSYGFTLGQVERISRFDFAAPLVSADDALAEAQAAAGADYAVIAWEGVSPGELAADLATLKQRMSTDAPAGAMTVVETTWDAARLQTEEAELVATERVFKTAVRHVPSGRIVALNELLSPRARPSNFVYQWDTIVQPEHRGHRLGMLVKAANILQVQAAVPESPAIITYNAEENRPMLAVNEALGFRPIAVEGAFELKL